MLPLTVPQQLCLIFFGYILVCFKGLKWKNWKTEANSYPYPDLGEGDHLDKNQYKKFMVEDHASWKV